MDDLFSGKATRETLPVYDMGTAVMIDKFEDEKIVRYVEMAKLETQSNFSQEIQFALIKTLDDIRFDVSDMTNRFNNLDKFNFKDLEDKNKSNFVQALKDGGSIEEVAKKIADNFFSSLKQLFDDYGPKAIRDIHIGNVGIDSTSPIDNPKFVFFDI
jgi:RNA processing factor Prp31